MDYLRNKAVRSQIVICVLFTVIWTVAGCLLDDRIGCLMFAACLTMNTVFLIYNYRRYRQIAEISLDIDRILHGDTTINFKDYQEGELAVLQNELSKMTVCLWEQAKLLKAEKIQLADSLANISHQLKTPLTSLNILNASLSRKNVSNEERFEMVKEQVSLLSRMEWLILTLLKVSQLDAGTVTLESKEISVRELIDYAVSPLEVSAELKGQTLRIDVPQDLMIRADLKWTAEAVGNVLKNCIEHTPIGGKIEIRVRKRPLLTEIVITDSGLGFAKDELPYLFDRFYHGKQNEKNNIGIGLALAKTIITNQNGTIIAENGSEGGAKFIISFY